MRKKHIPEPDDFAPLPKKSVVVEEGDFDKVIAGLLKSSPVGIYKVKTSGKRGPKKPPGSK